MKVAILAAIIAGTVTSAQAFTTLCRSYSDGCSASSNARMAPTSSSARAGREELTAPYAWVLLGRVAIEGRAAARLFDR